MAWIQVVDESDAEGKLRAYYEEIKKARGKIANIVKVHSLQPETMKAHLNLYQIIMFGSSGISRRQRELLGTVVSALNGCAYCVRHHSEALRSYIPDESLIAQVQQDYTQAALEAKDLAMLDYACKLTRIPADMNRNDVEKLRQAGFSDGEILTINLIASYFNFVNRVAEGLGVKFSEEEAKGYRY